LFFLFVSQRIKTANLLGLSKGITKYQLIDYCRVWHWPENVNNKNNCQSLNKLSIKSDLKRFFFKYTDFKFMYMLLYTYIVYLKSKPQILSWNYVFLICNFNKSAVFSNWNDILDLFLFMYTFSDLLLKSAFEWIFNVMQLILVKIKWKYLIQKFHDICLSYYFNVIQVKQ
jgi:hypothetical protein